MTANDSTITLELGHYRLREQIGGSAYGVIWRAEGPRGTRDVALKLINEAQMARALPPQRERWIASASNEINFLQLLEPWDERHIVRLLDSGWHNGLPVLALELMSCDLGRHMKHLRSQGTPLPLKRLLAWMAQLNQALAKVHQYGWRYLDLKPANVLVDTQLGSVKLADFGTNRRLDALNAHSYAGTANWQAPEQFFPAEGGYVTGTQSDYFALGALFYFMATGTQLRYCGDCAQAYREHHTAGADVLLRRHGGMPSTLQGDEEASFVRAIGTAAPSFTAPADRTDLGNGRAHASRVAAEAPEDAALRLLRHLLAAEPGARPRHAIDISRQLTAIAAAAGLQAALPARSVSAGLGPVDARHHHGFGSAAHTGWQSGTAA